MRELLRFLNPSNSIQREYREQPLSNFVEAISVQPLQTDAQIRCDPPLANNRYRKYGRFRETDS
jgi:hypothetical protein